MLCSVVLVFGCVVWQAVVIYCESIIPVWTLCGGLTLSLGLIHRDPRADLWALWWKIRACSTVFFRIPGLGAASVYLPPPRLSPYLLTSPHSRLPLYTTPFPPHPPQPWSRRRTCTCHRCKRPVFTLYPFLQKILRPARRFTRCLRCRSQKSLPQKVGLVPCRRPC